MNSTLLAGDSAIVTGAARGIGTAIAEALGRQGARVLLTDLEADAVAAVTIRLRAAGLQASFMPADLRDRGAAQMLVGHAQRVFDPISIFVHCACPSHQNENMFDSADQLWDDMFNVNVRAGRDIARLLAEHMRAREIKGRMLFISSMHAETPRGVPSYSVAKAGMTMLVKELARAVAPQGIRVNSIVPGSITDNTFPAAEKIAEKIPLRRIGRTSEVANMAVALLAEQFSSYITGATVVVDGGLSLYNWIEQG